MKKKDILDENIYRENINEIIKKKEVNFVDPIKFFFLIQIGVSDDLLFDTYKILEKCYDGDMNRQFTRGFSFEDFLAEKIKI